MDTGDLAGHASTLRHLLAPKQGLNWNAHHLDAHITEAMRLTRVVSDTLATVKGNVGRIDDILRRLLKHPMFERKEGKVCSGGVPTPLKPTMSNVALLTKRCRMDGHEQKLLET